MKWADIWMHLFGTVTLWGIDMGFWVSMAAVLLIVILMHIIFWSMKPKKAAPAALKAERLHADKRKQNRR